MLQSWHGKICMNILASTVMYLRKNGLAHRQFQPTIFWKRLKLNIAITYNLRLSRGATLKQFYILKKEIITFMNEKMNTQFTFLNDIITFLNEFHAKLQRKYSVLPDMYSDIKGCSMKSNYYYKRIDGKKLDDFFCCKKVMETINIIEKN